MSKPAIELVRNFLTNWQNQLCNAFTDIDGGQHGFTWDQWQRDEGGGGESRLLTQGSVFEQAGVNFSHIYGKTLPPSATANRPELAGCPFQAMGVSLVTHPINPYVPTSHANLRFFMAEPAHADPLWWFGGGFDLTPFYGFEEDVRHWHRTAHALCAPFGTDVYPCYKRWCDDYFYLKHRQEARGVGGLFFDDLNQGGFEQCFQFAEAVGQGYLDGYLPIVERRKNLPWGERERQFQLYRRGRYVEFNLVWDRGTLFGLQSAGRTEAILMSMPPLARWEVGYQPEVGSPEAALYNQFLPVREWL